MTSPINLVTQQIQRLIITCSEIMGDLQTRKLSPLNANDYLAEITEQALNMRKLMLVTYHEAKKLDLGEKSPESKLFQAELSHLDTAIKRLGTILVLSQETKPLDLNLDKTIELMEQKIREIKAPKLKSKLNNQIALLNDNREAAEKQMIAKLHGLREKIGKFNKPLKARASVAESGHFSELLDLAKKGDSFALSALVRMVQEDKIELSGILYTLLQRAEARDPQALRFIRELIQSKKWDDDTGSYFVILKKLAIAGDQQALSDLKELAKSHTFAFVELRLALSNLIRTGNEEALSTLIQLSKDDKSRSDSLVLDLLRLVETGSKSSLIELSKLVTDHKIAQHVFIQFFISRKQSPAKLIQGMSESDAASVFNTLKDLVNNKQLPPTEFIRILKNLACERNLLAIRHLHELAEQNDLRAIDTLTDVGQHIGSQLQFSDVLRIDLDHFIESIFPYVVIDPPEMRYAFFHAYLMPMELRSKLFQELRAYKRPFLEMEAQIERLYQENPEFVQTIIQSLEKKLSAATEPIVLEMLAVFIELFHENLGINEAHPLLIRAIEIGAAMNIEGLKNPAAIYKKQLVELKQKIDCIPPSIEVEGQRIHFNLREIQTILGSMTIPRSALHQDVTWGKWKQLIEQIEAKKDNPAVKAAIDDQSIGGWAALTAACLNDNAFFRQRIEFTEDPVPINYAQLNAILHKVFRLSNEGAPLSEREDRLIKFAESVKNCPGGKFEGVALYYARGLDSEDKFQIEIPNEPYPARAKAKSILAELYQNALTESFSGTNPLMQELTGETNIEQAAHQLT